MLASAHGEPVVPFEHRLGVLAIETYVSLLEFRLSILFIPALPRSHWCDHRAASLGTQACAGPP